jgi:hypothetical protein
LEGVIDEVQGRLHVLEQDEGRQKLKREERQTLRQAAKTKAGQREVVRKNGDMKVEGVMPKVASTPEKDSAGGLGRHSSGLRAQEQAYCWTADADRISITSHEAAVLKQAGPDEVKTMDLRQTPGLSNDLFSRLSKLVRPIRGARRHTA